MSDREGEGTSAEGEEASAEDNDDEEWAVSLSDLEEEPAAIEEPDEPIAAGDPSLESVVFVLLGVAFAVFVVSRLFLG